MKIIKKYNNALQAIYDHVGFTEDWVIYPIDDKTGMYWSVDFEKGHVNYADTLQGLQSGEGDIYQDVLYKQRFYKKWVYEGRLFTLVFCDSQVDGMKYFRLFDNKKRAQNGATN